MTNCNVCNNEAKQKCSGCSQVFYCSKDCQVSDWKRGHKNSCKPYEVKRNDKLGRYMTASRDLKAGEVLFREFAVVHGPKMLSHPICLGCHKTLIAKAPKMKFYRCSQCSWPLCSKACETLDPHIEECKLMTSKNYKCAIKSNCTTIHSDAIYCLIFPLRFLLLKRNQPKIFEKILLELESHVDTRIASGSYETLRLHLVPFVQKLLGEKDFPERLVLPAAAILDNNCFEISMPLRGVEMGGLFLQSLILCHDCVPNTKHYVNYLDSDIDIQHYQMTFQTTVPVRKGEQLTTTYTNTLKTTLERRRHLKQTKIFECDCKRCQDPSEFLTYGSSWNCQKCFGRVVAKNPLNNFSDWQCENCKLHYSREEITSKLNCLQSQLNSFVRKNPNQLEEFLAEHSKCIHSDHLTMVEIKYMLCLMYGNVGGYHYKDLSESLLHRKIELCKNLIKVYNEIDPGEANQRTNVMFELNCALIVDTKAKFNCNSIERKKAVDIIDDCLKIIKTCYNILIKETENKGIMDNRLEKIINESFL
ncbi:CLUMA_CG005137, isoform A [Clunio marinus]|uniref:CLUMA_CG005137, isoform A n=1 Tax=Clunio marinus TaxID=568069 RepID=A0A1J1HY61_9DIPT|nr:CLUMA_CG005137, isoform A [Clunio marinus]